MKHILLTLAFLLCIPAMHAQSFEGDPEKAVVWVSGIPTCPSDSKITALIEKVGIENLKKPKKNISKQESNTCREIGVAFNKGEMYDAADWYLERVKGYIEIVELKPEVVFEQPPKVEELPADMVASLEKDKAFLENIPKDFDNISPGDMKKLAQDIGGQIQKLIAEKEALIKSHASKEVIDAKDATINTLGKEKKIIDLTVETGELEVETVDLKQDKKQLTRYLYWAGAILLLLVLSVIALLQRKTIKVQDIEIQRQLEEINKKNTYLEYAARIIRHDMHSGINTYIPRGLSSLQKRIQPDVIAELKIGGSIQMIQEGLQHTQRVYKNVYEFTNLVKIKADFRREELDIKEALDKYLLKTSYASQIEIGDLGRLYVNEQLFCVSLDNIIRNGLKYNNNPDKKVKIYREGTDIVIEDNGTGLSMKEFNKIVKKGVDIESETGLGLTITKAVIEEHGFTISCESLDSGTKTKIKVS